jgi:hypothetical protein
MALKRFNEDFAFALPVFNEAAQTHVIESLVTEGDAGQQGLEVTFAAIHEGLTRNDTFYTREGLTNKVRNDQGQIGGLESWTNPYKAPILLNHDTTVDPIGRVKKAEWKEKAGAEKGHVEITALITQPDAIQKFLRGEYATGSIGMDVDKANCSICSADRLTNWCDHQRGKWYKKAPKGHEAEGSWIEAIDHEAGARRAHIQIGNVWAREYSIVNVPSDMRSIAKSMQVMECAFTESTGAVTHLLDAPAVVESVQTNTGDPVADVTNTDPAATTETVTEKSVAELCQAFRTELDADVLSLYTAITSEAATYELSDTHTYTQAELEKFATYILENNEDLEAELNEIKESVLSSTNTADLPDSAFALVKTVGEKALRILPFKDNKGKIEVAKLVTALSRCGQISGLTKTEQAKVLKKLRAAALKRGFSASTDEETQAEITAAKEFLAANGITLETAPVAGTEELTTKVATLEGQLADLKVLVEERETENAELVEQVSELKISAESQTKASVVEKILALENVAPDAREARVTELTKESAENLNGVLTTLQEANPDEVLVIQRLTKSGMSVGTNEDENSEEDKPTLTREDIISAFLGSKKSRETVSAAIKASRSK